MNNNEEIMNKLMKQKNVAVVSTAEAKKKRGAASAMTINHKEKEANKLDIYRFKSAAEQQQSSSSLEQH